MIETITVEFDEEPPPPCRKFALRGRQPEWLEAIESDLKAFSRTLVIAPGGVGKTTLFAALSHRFVERGFRVLVLENRDRLVQQTAARISKETGCNVDIEMADQHASPFAQIVVASVQTLGRLTRLTGFADNHFALCVADECHFSLSDGWQRIMNYFHYGAESLDPEWIAPKDGEYMPLARIAGFTATPDIGKRKSLGMFYHHISVNYSYLEAVNEGWLIRPIQKSIPVKVDLRKFKAANTPNGVDFKTSDISTALIPVIEELADQLVLHASNRKTIAFLPSVECAKLMTDAINRRGLRGMFVSGECLDIDEKTEAFMAAGKGTVLSNAIIYSYGVDFPDVDCIGWFRATLSRAFYVQGIYRASRVLPGVIDGLATAEERKAAIAASAKRDFLVLDPLFVSDRIDLMDAYDLFTDKPEVKARMKEMGDVPDLQEAAREAERDFIKALEKEARKHARKAARTVDPLALSVSLGDVGHYVPETTQDARPPTVGQLEFIRKQGLTVEGIKYLGQASKLIGRLMNRYKAGLATIGQLDFLRTLGYGEDATATLTQREASSLIDRTLAQKKASRTA